MKFKRINSVKLESIQRFLSKKIMVILLSLILILICVISFKQGLYLLSNDNYSPELNPTLSFSRYIESPAWRGYRVLGFASESEQADVFRSGMFAVLDTVLPNWSLGQLFYLLSMVIGSFSIAYLVKKLVQKTSLKPYANWSYLLGGICYFTTLWTMWVFYQAMAPYIANFGFFPLLLVSIYNFVEKKTLKTTLILFFTSVLFSSISVIATLFLVDFVFILFYSGFLSFSMSNSNMKEAFKSMALSIGIFLITQIFWLLPFVNYTFSTSEDIINSYTNRTITASVIDLETDMQSLINSARFYNRTLFELDGDKYVFPMADVFQQYDFYKVLGLLPAIFSIIGVIFGLFKKNFKILFWALVGLASIFLIKVLNPPFGSIFAWMQENVPLFKQVFRWPFSKIGEIFLISVSILSTFGILYLVQFLASFIRGEVVRRFVIITSFCIFCILPLAYSEYMFRGNMFSDRSVVKIPQEYYHLSEYLKKNDPTGRIYYAPPSNNNYFREYKWGFYGSQFISYILPNPVMDISLAIGSGVGETAMEEISNTLRAGKKEDFLNLLKKYDVKYVLLDKSVDEKGFSFDIDLRKIEEDLKDLERIWSEGDLIVFKTPEYERGIFKESLSNSIQTDFFVKDTPRYPTMSISEMSLKNMSIKDNEITGDFEYKGYSTYIHSNLTADIIGNLPSKVSYNNGVVNVSPSYPYISGDSSRVPFRSYQADFEYFVIGKNVVSKTELQKGLTVEDKYSDSVSIFGFNDNSFKKIEMLPLLAKSKGSDCSGGKVVESTLVLPQKISSGFEIKGSTELPCVYTSALMDTGQANILKIKINWESDKSNIPGFCIYSESRKRCLNSEKFLYSDSGYGEIETFIDTVIEKGEKLSLILYSTNIAGLVSDSIFRDVEISFTPLSTLLVVTNQSDVWKPKEIFLDDGEQYLVNIPVIKGENGYSYINVQNENLIWQPNKSDPSTSIFEVKNKGGQYQKVQNDYINQTVNLFTTNSNSKYLFYWKGSNISNIPGSLCLIYDKEDKCWFQDLLSSSESSSKMKIINADSEAKLLNLIYGSTSYTLKTENILEEFVFMRYPDAWREIKYIQETQPEYLEYEMNKISSSANSTYYEINRSDIKEDDGNILVSIPQAKATGWVGIYSKGILPRFLGKDQNVNVNGWKQAWDVSNIDFDNIFVFYWPNIISYLGYLSIISITVYFSYKLFFKYKNGKK